jgi:N-acetylmuramoyl-L-alanine amidase
MKHLRWLNVGVLTTAFLLTVGGSNSLKAGTFDSQEVNSDKFIAVAAPFGDNKYQLLIIEQRSNQRPCWQEVGSNPAIVDPLLLNFDFTGICGRSTDSNGYSIRMQGQDLGLDYLLRVVERDGELVLIGTNRMNRQAPTVEIGRTQGLSNGNFLKIELDPGWRFTRRAYQGRALGHIYLTSDTGVPATPAVSSPNPVTPAVQEPAPAETEREFIFTKPSEENTPPSVTIPTLDNPATNPQTLPPPASNQTVPTLED